MILCHKELHKKQRGYIKIKDYAERIFKSALIFLILKIHSNALDFMVGPEVRLHKVTAFSSYFSVFEK